MLSFFGKYLYVKSLRHWLVGSGDTDDQRILQSDWSKKRILVYNLKVYVIHKEKTLVSLLIFHSELFLIWPYYPQTNQNHHRQVYASLGVAGSSWPQPTNSSTLRCYLPLVNIFLKKKYDTDCFLPESLAIKESCNIIGQNTFVYLEIN